MTYILDQSTSLHAYLVKYNIVSFSLRNLKKKKTFEDCSHTLIFKGFWLIKFYLFKLAGTSNKSFFFNVFALLRKGALKKKFF